LETKFIEVEIAIQKLETVIGLTFHTHFFFYWKYYFLIYALLFLLNWHGPQLRAMTYSRLLYLSMCCVHTNLIYTSFCSIVYSFFLFC
jgi:hypothetical protein